MRRSGWHFLQIPGPTNVPERVLRVLSRPVIDHRSAEFAHLTLEVIEGLREIIQTVDPIALYPSSGTGAWEAALVNSLSPGDSVVLCESGYFALQWGRLAEKFGLRVARLSGDWRRGPDPDAIEDILARDRTRTIKAVLVVHNETSTGVRSRIPEIRRALDRSRHPALLIVDTISSLGSIDYRHDEWSVDITIGCSQKGLMLPPGLGLNAVSEKALLAAASASLPKSYWEWEPMLAANRTGLFPFTPPTTLLYGLQEALQMLREEGLPHVFMRHARHAEAMRAAVEAWQLEVFCLDPREYSDSVTAVLVPEGYDADVLRSRVLEDFNMSLGSGLDRLAGQVFRVGHLGDFSDLMLAGTLCGIELGLAACGFPFSSGGAASALEYLKTHGIPGSTTLAP